MKVIIAGSRDFNDYELLCKVCDHKLQNQKDIIIVSGKAPGADSLGERYAKEKGYILKEFPADWNNIEDKPKNEIKINKFGKKYWVKAGFVRNEEMANYADACIVFMKKGGTPGSQDMIDLANKYKLKLKVVNF